MKYKMGSSVGTQIGINVEIVVSCPVCADYNVDLVLNICLSCGYDNSMSTKWIIRKL